MAIKSVLQPIFLLPLFFTCGFTEPIFFYGDQSSVFKGPLRDPFIAFFGGGDDQENNGDRKYGDGNGEYKGRWELVSPNSGLMAMHMALLPPTNKVVMVEPTNFGPSQVRFSSWFTCHDYLSFLRKWTPWSWTTINYDHNCWAHAIEFDAHTAAITPLQMVSNAWGSSGGLSADGTLVQVGGWGGGANTVRLLSGSNPSSRCTEYPNALLRKRWYSTQQILPDGRFIVVGGRRMFNYEFVPASDSKVFKLPFLRRTSDYLENNLYPFVFLSTDGNLFLFANDRSILLNPITNVVIRRFPVLPGGSRNYPASGMSALLPIQLHDPQPNVTRAEVIVCGGAKPHAAKLAEKGVYLPALRDCGRMVITDTNATWTKEVMPTARVMGDMLVLPTGDLLMLNGAKRGTSGWNFSDDPNYVPVIYKPDSQDARRFTELKAASIPRMYHSTSALLPDGTILVAGSNTKSNDFPNPTEFRVEKFLPPYLDPRRTSDRPKIESNFKYKILEYGKSFTITFKSETMGRANLWDLKVSMYAPPFTTHGFSMNQRLLILAVIRLINAGGGRYRISVVAPPSAEVAPPGYYLMFVVHQGLPSVGVWTKI